MHVKKITKSRFSPLSCVFMLCVQEGVAEDIKDRFLLTTDFVYLQRYHVNDRSIAVDTDRISCEDGCFSNSVLDTTKLIQGYMPGFHIDLACFMTKRSSYEVGFLYLWEMDNTETRSPKGILSVPFRHSSFVRDYIEVDSLTANYKSQFYTGDLNYWYMFSTSRSSYFFLAGMAGMRFTNLTERFLLDVEKGHNQSDYKIKAANDLLGVQVGFDFRIQPNRYFSWDLLVKAGADLNRIATQIFLGDNNNTITLRNYNRQLTQSGMFAEVDAGATYSPLEWMTIRLGYEMLYFGGLALAPDQITFSSDQIRDSLIEGAPKRVWDNGYIILYGIYTGISFSF